MLAETRRRHGCAGQEAVDNTFVDFLNMDEHYQSGLQFEARRLLGYRKEKPTFKAQDVFDIKKCAIPQTARRCYEEIKGCSALPFSRDSAISPIGKGIIRAVPDTGSLEVAAPTFDFLGFTFYIGKSRKGRAIPKLSTSGKRARSKLAKVKDWCVKVTN